MRFGDFGWHAPCVMDCVDCSVCEFAYKSTYQFALAQNARTVDA